jgi:NTE family protein
MKIGLALSGGGLRATVFHLGVLSRLAAEDHLNAITHLSTVSGGSLCAGLVYSANQYRWPTPTQLQQIVIPRIAQLITQTDLQGLYVRRLLRAPWSVLRGRANEIAYLMRVRWGIDASLQDLSDPDEHRGQPYWHIVTTCYETGKSWYFTKARMGDYLFGYSMRPEIALSDALAASAAVPGLIGPLELDARGYQWLQFARGQQATRIAPMFAKVHLWDGGVYDNLGLEPLTNYSGTTDSYAYRKGVDFVIVSDASGVPQAQAYPTGWGKAASPMRIVDVLKDQVRALRARSVIAYIKRSEHAFPPGRYFQIDNSCEEMVSKGYRTREEAAALCAGYFPAVKAQALAHMATTLRQLSPVEFGDLYRHGYEVADVTLHIFDSQRFRLLRYDPDQHSV